MKKYINILCILILSLFVINSTFANTTQGYLINSNVSIYKIYKETILSRHQIKKDFKDWVALNNKIERFFIKVRTLNNKTQKLSELEKKFWDILKKYENKKVTLKEDKYLNIVRNLYLRTILEIRNSK